MLPFSSQIEQICSQIRCSKNKIEGLFPSSSDKKEGWYPLADIYSKYIPYPFKNNSLSLPFEVKVALVQKYLYDVLYINGTCNALEEPLPTPEEYPKLDIIDPIPNVIESQQWQLVSKLFDGKMVLTKNNSIVEAYSGEYIANDDPEDTYTIIKPKKKQDAGFLYFESKDLVTGSFQKTRFYFNVSVSHRRLITSWIVWGLEQYDIPHLIKYYYSSASRVDNIVLYINNDHSLATLFALSDIFPKIAPYLLNKLPLFLNQLEIFDSKIGTAESPIGDSSFGTHRTTILAEIFLNYFDSVAADDTQTCHPDFQYVLDCITRKGYDHASFYLNPNSTYPQQLFKGCIHSHPTKIFIVPSNLKAVCYIADWICREAFWVSDTHCEWIGTVSEQQESAWGEDCEFIPDTFYRGKLGIYVFLLALSKIVDRPLYSFVGQKIIKNISKPPQEIINFIKNVENWEPKPVKKVPQLMTTSITEFVFPSIKSEPTIRRRWNNARKSFNQLKSLLIDPKSIELSVDISKIPLLYLNDQGIAIFCPSFNGLSLIGYGSLSILFENLPRPSEELMNY